jgi:hypothetical protein
MVNHIVAEQHWVKNWDESTDKSSIYRNVHYPKAFIGSARVHSARRGNKWVMADTKVKVIGYATKLDDARRLFRDIMQARAQGLYH